MNTVISNPAIGLAERPFRVHFSQPGAEDRAEVEQFIGEIFRKAYGAQIKRFKPCLMSLRDRDNRLVAACGFRSAALEPLLLENYLDQPVETLLSEHVGYPVGRDEIVGVGNFSVAEPGMARYLITAIDDHLYATANRWAAFTAVPMLHNIFIKLKRNPVILGAADMNRLPPEDRSGWGSYYEQKPQVMAVKRLEQSSISEVPIIRNLSAGMHEHVIGTRCQTCGLIVREK